MSGIQNWTCAGRRLEIGGRLPTVTALLGFLKKIVSKHLAANKIVSLAFQQKSSLVPGMNPDPVEIVEHSLSQK